MQLEFIVREVKKNTKLDIELLRRFDGENQFIIVGEVEVPGYGDCYMVQHIGDELKLIPGVNIAEQAYTCLKSDLKETGSCFDTAVLDIPKEYLTLDVVDDILRLNSQCD